MIGIIIGAILAVSLLTAFFSGVFIGRRENRLLPFFGMRPMHREFIPKNAGFGAMGTIESLGENTLVVRDRTGALKTVLIDNQTKIRQGHTGIKFTDLKKDGQVIILGEPDKDGGTIKAKLIRSLWKS